ncbi:DUF1800 domain-containing protein [Angustibacter aerolatus]
MLRGAVSTAAAGTATSAAVYLPTDSRLHLLRRATFGPTQASLDELATLGRAAWLDRQLKPSTIDDAACDGYVGRLPSLTRPIWKVRDDYSGQNGTWALMNALVQATVTRAIWSKRQLLEVMVDLWSNHFNVTCPSADVWDSRASYDQLLRKHALGSFSDMLVGVSTHPSMLRYLDNASSTDTAPNENHGRELLELHTVGVGSYPESAVKQSARILTGLSVSSDSGDFLYKPWYHWVGPVSVLGFSHVNDTETGGYDVAVKYLRYLATHPSTAKNVATKLARRFVSDTPSDALVSELASVYLKNATQIAPVLRALFASAEFAASTGAKVKRPYEDLVSTVRTLGITPAATGTAGIQALSWLASEAGQPALGWGPPNGYPDVAAAWQSPDQTLRRWNQHVGLAAKWWPSTTDLTYPGVERLLPSPLPATHGALLDVLSTKLVFRALRPAHRTAILGFLNVTASTPLRSTSEMATWRLPYVVALILDTPSFQLR